MLHALFRLVTSRPELLADHAEAYADLVAEELHAARTRWRRRLMLGGIAAGGALLALILGGVALMLWAAQPEGAMRAAWVLYAVPAVPAVLAFVCAAMLSADTPAGGMQTLREQLAADIAMLKEAGA